MKRLILLLIIIVLVSHQAMATHNRAGEITLTQLDELTYEITITTFTYTLSQADRDRLGVLWGDNTFSYAERESWTKLPYFYQKNTYRTRHTYPGPGIYEIVVQDPNRNDGVKNIPSSVNVVFSIKTTIMINTSLGGNSTPVLLNPPYDRAAYGQVFIHNPAAYDADGDSISYKLTTCTEQDGRPIQGYTLPPASDTLYIHPLTGDLTWITPSDTGIFNIAIDVEEWRSGVKIGNIVRDMQIEVYNTDNHPPVQTDPGNFCVEAGSPVIFDIIATDEDMDSIYQWATGGPFVVETDPATYTVFRDSAALGYSRARFRWNTSCMHVREQYYTAVFKAEDSHPETPLVDIRNVNIKVLGQAPEAPLLIPGSNSVTLTWPAEECPLVSSYNVYRKNGPAAYLPDSCTGGIPGSTGYALVGQTEGRLDTMFFDNNAGAGLEQGEEYCYVIVAVYEDGALSYPSPESCTPLVEGSPSLLQVSVTDHSSEGSILISWAQPDLDTIPVSGPYEYLIYRSADLLGQQMELIASKETAILEDTTWTDPDVNTLEFPWSYKVELYNNTPGNRFLIGQAELASSFYPELLGSDKRVEIRMRKNVPWINYDYTIYRQNQLTLEFDSVGFTTSEMYVDSALVNGREYCYRVRSTGWRILDGVLYENENWSHTNCTTPVDTIAPCPPIVSAYSECDEGFNHISWEYVAEPPCDDDVVAYHLYFSQTYDMNPVLIATFDDKWDTAYNHYPDGSLTGCYYVSAIDSAGNESRLSVMACLDECSNYILPNVFSPNNDGINDIFRPNRNAYVEKVDMQIFDRTGILVFQTEDPDINWDGKIMGSKKLVTPGVYYYICEVYEYRLSGLYVTPLKGFIYVYSGEENETPEIETK